MKVLDEIVIRSGGKAHCIQLCLGDLTDLAEDDSVDLLVVSAFPDNYVPTPSSLIGALARKGVSVRDLARRKSVDLRQAFSCWLSPELDSAEPTLRYKRILCFEPLVRGEAPEVVGDIFRALAPFLVDPPISKVAMPVVAAGDQGYEIRAMLPPLVDAAVNWMRNGMPLELLKLVIHSKGTAAEALQLFASFKEDVSSPSPSSETHADFDVFVSYAHDDTVAAQLAAEELKNKGLRVFIDIHTLESGTAWQQAIFSSLDRCRKLLAIYSPGYIASKVCQEEFNIGWARARKLSTEVVFPVYWRSADLPTYMEMLNYVDCREAEQRRLVRACEQLTESLERE